MLQLLLLLACNPSPDTGCVPEEEIPCDGIDQDCDGQDLTDADGDGFACEDDCDDTDATVHPGAVDFPGDGRDGDCDGQVDEPPLDLSDSQVVATYSHSARSIAVDAGHLFVPDNPNDRLLVFDVSTLQQVTTIPTGDFPYILGVGQGYVVATNAYDTTATVVDSDQATKVADVTVCEYPWVAVVDQKTKERWETTSTTSVRSTSIGHNPSLGHHRKEPPVAQGAHE